MTLPFLFTINNKMYKMERLDYYDIIPRGMDAYLSAHGHHFSKPMLEWAVSMMEDRGGNKVGLVPKEEVDKKLEMYGQKLRRKEGYYDSSYVWCMAISDYFGFSIPDEKHLAIFVRDYIDDIDGNPTRAFDEFYINCVAKGVDIPWEDMI